MEVLAILIVLAAIAGVIGGLVSIFQIHDLKARLRSLEYQLDTLRRSLTDDAGTATTRSRTPQQTPDVAARRSNVELDRDLRPAPSAEQAPELAQDTTGDSAAVAPPPAPRPAAAPAPEVQHPEPLLSRYDIAGHLKNWWMIWLGGLCVALSGIFLARYSIEMGLLGPGARVILGLLMGLGLHGGAEWLRRRTGETHPAFAAMAGGGSITLFAALLAALHLYGFISGGTTFVLLAVVALATMAMAYIHGPALAAIGLLGAFVVPILVSDGSGRIVFALGYSLIISASALLLSRYVYRPWLWWGIVAGALAWWVISLTTSLAEGWRGWYLAGLGYLLLSVPRFDWQLQRAVKVAGDSYKSLLKPGVTEVPENHIPGCVLLLVLAQAFTILFEDDLTGAVVNYSPLLLLMLLAARTRESLGAMPWLLLLLQIGAIVLSRVEGVDDRFVVMQLSEVAAGHLYAYAAATSLLIVTLSFWNAAQSRFVALWYSLMTVGPLLLMALAYFMTERFVVNFTWGLVTAMVALAYLAVAVGALRKSTVETLVVWLFFGGHFALSLAAIMLLRNASLTLVFAAQIVSASWIIARFRLPELGWMLKLLVALVIFRLSFNPWIAGYPADVHWSLWTFGGATLCCIAAMRQLREYPLLARWTEASAMHLLVLTLWTELRYWLHDGNVFAPEYTALEASLYMLLFGAVGLVYYRRSLVSEHLAAFGRIMSMVLLGLALANYAVILFATAYSLQWLWGDVGRTPVFNLMMLLLYGVPVVLGALVVLFYDRRVWRPAMLFTGLAGFIFVSMQIRHMWQGSVRLSLPTGDGELYTYSAVWLVMAVVAILGGAWRLGQGTYRAGMLLLGLVIGKLFLVDMSDLDGLLRVASFMGLGLCLLGISYLHQKIQKGMAS